MVGSPDCRSGDAETKARKSEARWQRASLRRAEIVRWVTPRAPAENPAASLNQPLGVFVRRRNAPVFLAIPIPAPLPHVSMHVVNSECVALSPCADGLGPPVRI